MLSKLTLSHSLSLSLSLSVEALNLYNLFSIQQISFTTLFPYNVPLSLFKFIITCPTNVFLSVINCWAFTVHMSQTSIKVYSEMGLLKLPLVVLLFSVFSLLGFIVLCDDSELTVKFLKTPHAFSKHKSTMFVFEVLVGGSGTCTNCNITCKVR